MAAPKSVDEHIDLHFKLAKLKLWFAWNRARSHPEESFEFILRRRTNIWRLSVMEAGPSGPATEEEFARPDWRALLDPLLELFDRTKEYTDATQFEEGGFDIFRVSLEKKALATYNDGPVKPNGAMGALSYDPPTPENPVRVYFHIGNPLQPRSIFDDSTYLPGCLMTLMEDAESKHNATELTTGTWLNSHPAFMKNFPREYIDNRAPEEKDIRWGAGFWGQMINARGCFNEKHGQYLRRTVEMPYWRRVGWCSFAALRRHIADIS